MIWNINKTIATRGVKYNLLYKYIPKEYFKDELTLIDDAVINFYFIGFDSTNYEILKKLILHNHLYKDIDGKKELYKFNYGFVNKNAYDGEKNLFKILKDSVDEGARVNKVFKNFSLQLRSEENLMHHVHTDELSIIFVALGDDFFNEVFSEYYEDFDNVIMFVRYDEEPQTHTKKTIAFGDLRMSSYGTNYEYEELREIKEAIFNDNAKEENLFDELALEIFRLLALYGYTIVSDEIKEQEIVSKDEYIKNVCSNTSDLYPFINQTKNLYLAMKKLKMVSDFEFDFENLYDKLSANNYNIVKLNHKR